MRITQSHPSFLNVEVTMHKKWCRLLKTNFLVCPTRRIKDRRFIVELRDRTMNITLLLYVKIESKSSAFGIRCRSFLHISHIRQKLSKPNIFLCAMASGHILCLCRRQCNGWLFLAFPQNDSNANKKHVPHDALPIICISYPIRIAKFSQGNISASKA